MLSRTSVLLAKLDLFDELSIMCPTLTIIIHRIFVFSFLQLFFLIQ